MANWGQVDFSELVALRDKFQNLQNIIDDFCIQVTQEISQDFVKAVIAKTPGGQTGALKNNWVSNIIKEGNIYKIEVINPLKYAEFVEFGHRQQPGRYVKAIGKRLKKGWVEGKLMLTITERDLQRNLDKIIREKVNAFIMEALQ
ncbi:HK97 gp10 family phage protein [Clostridium sp. MD294]|uniref:HK97 gp10 family phage protein n=1 Tax=Clostridium sp. MD294 TaxID=97138 RepID=UPI0002CBF602|nr:HK97 gp10 family phage protein [Clostridium sp. MD294]NDO45461.1 HK97 gp10 family phage protein [Clostridium sp. MD294]USF30890.1 hypothetical protein C820_002334 [Clostridium sp. MD294]